MSEIQVSAWRVDIIESESGWGSKIDETKYFDSEQAAKDFVESYNAKDDERRCRGYPCHGYGHPDGG